MSPVNENSHESVPYQLGKLNAKVDLLLTRGEEDRRAQSKIVTRVEALERWKWTLIGASAGTGGVVSFVVSKVAGGG